MSAKNTGGPAFPMQEPQAIHAYAAAKIQGITDADSRDAEYMKARAEAVGGMTLRDYFAAKAMAGVWACGGNMDGMQEKIAEAAYRQADAMIAAREGGE